MKNSFKTGNRSFFGMDVLPEDTMEQVTHKIQDKGGINPCNVSLCRLEKLVISFCWKIYQQKYNIDLLRKMTSFLIRMTFPYQLSVSESKTKSLDQ